MGFDKRYRVIVRHDGHITWVPGFNFQTHCLLNLRKFPFDRQECSITFSGWLYGRLEVDLEHLLDRVLLHRYDDNGEWKIDHTSTDRTYIQTSTVVEERLAFPVLSFKIAIQRKSQYYVITMLVPSVVITLTSTLVFVVPPESPAKCQLGVSILLSFTVLLLLLAEVMPPTIRQLPLYGTHPPLLCLLVPSTIQNEHIGVIRH